MIRTVSLVNFKAFDDIELPVRAMTLLSGLNGSGKSSVLQALGMLRQSYDTGGIAMGELGLNGPLVQFGTGRDVLHQDFKERRIAVGLVVDDGSGPRSLEWSAEPFPEDDVLVCTKRPTDGATSGVNLFEKGFQFLRADRITPSVTFPKSQHAIGGARFLGARGEYAGHFLLKYGQEITVSAPLRHPLQQEATSLLSQVNAWMQDFSPGVRLDLDAVAMTDFVRLSYAFKSKGSSYSEPLRPTNVGFGLTHVLPVLTACLAADAGTLIIVENPEAQLHPRGQVAMGRLLALTAASGVQVLVESHSDHVLNGIRLVAKQGAIDPDEIGLHFFSRQAGEATVRESPVVGADGRLSFWPENFFDQWERSLDALLA